MKRLVAAALAAAAATAVALTTGATTSSAAGLCITGSVTVNGTTTPIDQCLPPAS